MGSFPRARPRDLRFRDIRRDVAVKLLRDDDDGGLADSVTRDT